MADPTYQLQVKSGRKSGATHPVPLGKLSVGTTLDSEFFIGCLDMWQQLLRADASADLRSASASRDVLPEQLMRMTINHTTTGLSLTVEEGFVEIGQRRLLPGESCVVSVAALIRLGASELEIQAINLPSEDDARSLLKTPSTSVASKSPSGAVLNWLGGKVAINGLTAIAVTALSLAIFINTPDSTELSTIEPTISESMTSVDILPVAATRAENLPNIRKGHIYNDPIVAVVSSEPAFLMTASGQRYDLGSVVDDGFKISLIDSSHIEFTRGSKQITHTY